MSGDSVNRVETTTRLAQWRVDAPASYAFRKSDPFRIGLWNWYLSLERNKQLVVKLCPDVSSLIKNQPPPIASFVIKLVSPAHPTRRILVHPGVCDRQLKCNEDFVWAIDTLLIGRFIIDVEFLDLKIAPPSGGEPTSIWNGNHIERHSGCSALSHLARMLSERVLTDITINSMNGSIGAHRAILAARSPVFQRMFSHNLKEKEQSTVDIPDMTYEACQAFLNYIYGNFQSDEFLEHRLALLQAADKYDVVDLREVCHNSLLEDIDTNNVLERLQIAHLYDLLKLKRSCMGYLINFGKIYELRDEFNGFIHTADRELLAELFQEILATWKGL